MGKAMQLAGSTFTVESARTCPSPCRCGLQTDGSWSARTYELGLWAAGCSAGLRKCELAFFSFLFFSFPSSLRTSFFFLPFRVLP
jgi:hypothetical protein